MRLHEKRLSLTIFRGEIIWKPRRRPIYAAMLPPSTIFQSATCLASWFSEVSRASLRTALYSQTHKTNAHPIRAGRHLHVYDTTLIGITNTYYPTSAIFHVNFTYPHHRLLDIKLSALG